MAGLSGGIVLYIAASTGAPIWVTGIQELIRT